MILSISSRAFQRAFTIYLQHLALIQPRTSPQKFQISFPPRQFNFISVSHWEVHSAEGVPYRAHGLVLMAGSDYFCAAYTGGWANTSGHHVLPAVPAKALEACIDWIYTGACEAADDQALHDILKAAMYLQIRPLADEAYRAMLSRLGPRTALATLIPLPPAALVLQLRIARIRARGRSSSNIGL